MSSNKIGENHVSDDNVPEARHQIKAYNMSEHYYAPHANLVSSPRTVVRLDTVPREKDVVFTDGLQNPVEDTDVMF